MSEKKAIDLRPVTLHRKDDDEGGWVITLRWPLLAILAISWVLAFLLDMWRAS